MKPSRGEEKWKVAVTGGAGQLGRLILRRLVNDRAVSSVVCLDLHPPRLSHPKLEPAIADLRTADLDHLFMGCNVVIHLAFLIGEYLPRQRFHAVNVKGSMRVFQAAAAAGASQIIYSSSAAVYGMVPGHPEPVVEETPRVHQAAFSYAAAKYEVEKFLDTFEQEHPSLQVVRLRPVVLVGEEMENPMGKLMRRRRLPSFGEAPLPIVWDEDVADAALLALHQRASGAFNLAADDPLPPVALAEETGMGAMQIPHGLAMRIARLSPLLSKVGLGSLIDPAWIETSDVRLVLSSAKARGVLGWKPRCNTAVEVMQHFLATVPQKVERRIAAFMKMAALVGRCGPRQPELRSIRLAIHLHLTGPGGGDFGIVVEDGRVKASAVPPLSVMAVITMRSSVFLDLLAGRTDWGSAQLTGKVHAEGQAHAPMIVAGMIANYRMRSQQPGVSGFLTRTMARWIESGAGN